MDVILTLILYTFINVFSSMAIDKSYIQELLNMSSRIVGGQDCSVENYPYMVSVHFPTPDLQHRCGGTLINSLNVLSAAHCFVHQFDLDYYLIVAGISDMKEMNRSLLDEDEWERNRKLSNFYGQKCGISGILVHKEYDTETQRNDLALVKLNRKMIPNLKVGFALLPLSNRDNLSAVYSQCTAIGWGSKFPMQNSSEPFLEFPNATFRNSTLLQCVDLPLVDNEICNHLLKDFTDFRVCERQLCTLVAGGTKDACYGDSGGPLICDHIQMGIISAGWGCALPGVPAVFTKIDGFTDWILKNSETKSTSPIRHVYSSYAPVFDTLYVLVVLLYFGLMFL